MPPSATCWRKIWEHPSLNGLEAKSVGSSKTALPSRLRRRSQYTRAAIAAEPIARRAATDSPPACQTSTPTTSPPMPITERNAPTTSTDRSPVYGTSRIDLLPIRTAVMIKASIEESDAPRQQGCHEATDQRPDRGSDRTGCADQREHTCSGLSLEVAVNQRLHRRQVQRGAQSTDDGPEHDDRRQTLREHHRQSAEHVQEQTGPIGALAAEEVADLAADQDEGGGDQRLDRDRRLHAAHRRIEVVHDG